MESNNRSSNLSKALIFFNHPQSQDPRGVQDRPPSPFSSRCSPIPLTSCDSVLGPSHPTPHGEVGRQQAKGSPWEGEPQGCNKTGAMEDLGPGHGHSSPWPFSGYPSDVSSGIPLMFGGSAQILAAGLGFAAPHLV